MAKKLKTHTEETGSNHTEETGSSDSETNTEAVPKTTETNTKTVRENRILPLIVSFEDGTEKNFGVRSNLLDDVVIDVEAKTVTVKVYFSDGTYLPFTTQINEIKEFHLKVFAEGLLAKAKASCSSATGDLDKAKAIVRKKLEQEYPQEIFVERLTGGESVTPFTQLELVWAFSQKIDPNSPEGYNLVKEKFSPMSRKDRIEYKQTREWRLAFLDMEREKLLADKTV